MFLHKSTSISGLVAVNYIVLMEQVTTIAHCAKVYGTTATSILQTCRLAQVKSGGEERQHRRQYFQKGRKQEICNVPDCAVGLSRTNERYHCPGCLRFFKRRWQRTDNHASKCVQFSHFLSSSKLMTNHAKGLSETQALVSIAVIPANTKLCHT